MNDDLILRFGYSELYEWAVTPENTSRIGKFVQFDEHEPNKIRLCKDKKNIIGVTTINTVVDSDNPEHWHAKNLFNEYGDIYLQKERLAIGQKVYDQQEEFAFIKTQPYEQLIPITNPDYDDNKKYVKRTNREEWVRVNLMGKVIVEDDGTCVPGEYCTPYVGKMKQKQGTVTHCDAKEKIKYYVIQRVSDKTVIILNK